MCVCVCVWAPKDMRRIIDIVCIRSLISEEVKEEELFAD